jgi:hypothetical protein
LLKDCNRRTPQAGLKFVAELALLMILLGFQRGVLPVEFFKAMKFLIKQVFR